MLVSTGRIGHIFGVEGNTVRVWRQRYDDFPAPETDVPYPMYDLGKIQRWHASRWPNRVDRWQMRIHRFRASSEGVKLTTTKSGNLDFAQGYLKAIRDLMFGDWRVFYTKDGFSAHKGGDTEVWVVDPTDEDPEPWYVYDTRFKTMGTVPRKER
jgi:hypothetical protein